MASHQRTPPAHSRVSYDKRLSVSQIVNVENIIAQKRQPNYVQNGRNS